jgi:hypothetical protein
LVRSDHSHGNLCAWRGILDLYAITGNRTYLERARAKWDAAVKGGFVWPLGGIGEHWYVSYAYDEGCSEADWLRFSLDLWRSTSTATRPGPPVSPIRAMSNIGSQSNDCHPKAVTRASPSLKARWAGRGLLVSVSITARAWGLLPASGTFLLAHASGLETRGISPARITIIRWLQYNGRLSQRI